MFDTPSKAFGLSSPSGILLKLRYDIARLKKARWTLDIRYAALDCAISAWHLTDWLLAEVSPEQYSLLCGQKKGDGKKTSKGFVARNSHRLPGLAECQLIANTIKHRNLAMPDDPGLSASTRVRFDPPFNTNDPASWPLITTWSQAYVERNGVRVDAVKFFSDIERGWRHVLVEEGCLGIELRDRELDDGDFDPDAFNEDR